MKHLVAFAAAVALLCSAANAAGKDCSNAEESPRIENGEFHATGSIALQGVELLLVTDDVRIERIDRTAIEVDVRKRLGFGGHPPRSILRSEWPRYMGLMARRDGGVLMVTTFGTWSNIEGSARVFATLRVPPTLRVARIYDYEPSILEQAIQADEQRERCGGTWYSIVRPPADWQRLDFEDESPVRP